MKINFLSVALGIALSATVWSASAQKNYTEGLVTMKTNSQGQDIELKEYFRTDSTAVTFSAGPVNIYTPEEINKVLNSFPVLTFAPTAETKQVAGFNCKKVVATDTKTQKTYDVWVMNDISLPAAVIDKYYASVGGVPIQYSSFQIGPDGALVIAEYTITAVSDQKAPAGTFGIAPDFDKISKTAFEAMARGNQ
jgi:hypothetical protein